MVDAEAARIVKHVCEDDGVEAFRQLTCRFDPHTALTKSHRLRAIPKLPEANKAKKNTDVPAVLAKFGDLLFNYAEDYQMEAMSDDLKKKLRKMKPAAPKQTVKDIIMFRNMKEDTLTSSTR